MRNKNHSCAAESTFLFSWIFPPDYLAKLMGLYSLLNQRPPSRFTGAREDAPRSTARSTTEASKRGKYVPLKYTNNTISPSRDVITQLLHPSLLLTVEKVSQMFLNTFKSFGKKKKIMGAISKQDTKYSWLLYISVKKFLQRISYLLVWFFFPQVSSQTL